ncbi:MAG: hypothetical protein A2Y94_14155 [Caldithrix sp. RBG_13_44_9]|nr:MAG: hypothetical protein A2Y94_14155 [Caldithrix sp. RBG_13_44_9]
MKGINSQHNDGTQQERLEAILDAKRQDCVKAGLIIEFKTTVENFQVVYDLMETSAATVWLSGFQFSNLAVRLLSSTLVLEENLPILNGQTSRLKAMCRLERDRMNRLSNSMFIKFRYKNFWSKELKEENETKRTFSEKSLVVK